jgi:hypothetical protein
MDILEKIKEKHNTCVNILEIDPNNLLDLPEEYRNFSNCKGVEDSYEALDYASRIGYITIVDLEKNEIYIDNALKKFPNCIDVGFENTLFLKHFLDEFNKTKSVFYFKHCPKESHWRYTLIIATFDEGISWKLYPYESTLSEIEKYISGKQIIKTVYDLKDIIN